ncbi:hypothetical protein TNCV_1957821 [Trichonephila clavipes]|nr:hypothetical protein TNCV_1957821 [Trichonephila clavipes]
MYGSFMRRYAGKRNGECLGSIKHVVGVKISISGKEIAPYSSQNHTEFLPQRQMANNQSVRRHLDALPEVESLGSWRRNSYPGFSSDVHEEPHPQMTSTLSYRPEKQAADSGEKSLDTDTCDWTTDIAFYRGQKTARWWSVCTTPCTVCTFNPPIGEGVLLSAGSTGIGETMNRDEYSLQMRADSV